jgi:glycosyltransferase involved in cell wall biosynthesis
MLGLGVTILLVVAAVVVLLYQGAPILFAYELTRLEPAPRLAAMPSRGRVSVIVAARNEADAIGATLDDLLAQDYPDLDIVVVEGGSTDGTREVIRAREPRVRCLEEPPLPPGWLGKSWACWVGANATTTPWLLFLDADVRTDPAAVRTAVDWAVEEKLDLASIGVQVEMVGFWERLILPLWIQRILLRYRPSRMERARPRAPMVNGQFWLTPREAYRRAGGHEAVKGWIMEDIAIARRYRDLGLSLRFAWSPPLGRTRMYRDREEMFEGLLKNAHGLEFSAARQTGTLLALFAFYLLPLGLLPLAIVEGDPLLIGLGAFLYLALFGKHVAFARSTGAPAAYGLLYPLAIAWYLRVTAISLARGVRARPVIWKGRAYPVQR